MRRVIFSLSAIALLTCLASCASPRVERRNYTSSNDTPVISFSHGGAWNPLFRYVVDGVHACREVSRLKTDNKTGITHMALAQQQEVLPGAEKWKAFWKRIEPLQLQEWRATYNAKEIGSRVDDGTQWIMRYTHDGKDHKSSGDNAYPAIGHPQTGTLDPASFDELAAAFDALFPTPQAQFLKHH